MKNESVTTTLRYNYKYSELIFQIFELKIFQKAKNCILVFISAQYTGEYLKRECNWVDVLIGKCIKLVEILKEYPMMLISKVVTGKVKVV
jgi:hypothetical protein